MAKRAKQRAVLKVVQISNPTVIKTDVASFRELVQELTGKNYQPARRPMEYKSSRLASAARGAGEYLFATSTMQASDDSWSSNWSDKSDESSNGGFDDMDIISALISSHPLPDCTMLPPLLF